jgi:hypothetical protein
MVVQFLSSLGLHLNPLDLLSHLTSLQLPLRSLFALGKEGDVLREPSAGVLGSAPDFIHIAIVYHLVISDQLETGTIRLDTRFAGLVVTFNLEVLIRIKVYKTIYIA